mmetsp:Transcript_13487/g.33882  ORF Transcript_13487/g.33882 Transcript_13487/m.33882 type:complete len:103 (-) Transcript_13487:1745-2053(-)
MGCFNSKDSVPGKSAKLRLPSPWKAHDPITYSELQKLRNEFWDTAPHYGGDQVIWDALKSASEVDIQSAAVILDAAEIIVASSDMSLCYDQKGASVHVLGDG